MKSHLVEMLNKAIIIIIIIIIIINSSMFLGNRSNSVAQLVEHSTAVREVAGSNLGRTNTRGL